MKIKMLLGSVALAGVMLTDLTAVASDGYQHIRNATGKIQISDKTFLIDPMLAEKGKYEGFPGTHNSHLRNPMTELPMRVEDTYKDVDGIIVTHTHLDHWDPVAQELLPKNMLVVTQHEEDAALIRDKGFKNVTVLKDTFQLDEVTLIKTGGSHGTPEMYASPLGKVLGDAMGVIFKADNHPTIYLVGDTVWNAEVNKAIMKYNPDVLILNTGDARPLPFPDDGIIMSKKDVRQAYKMLPEAKVIAVHMDAVNHMTVTSDEMRAYVKENKMNDRVYVPQQGDIITY